MKYVMIVPDGLTDLRIKKYNYKTPLDIASIPTIDYILHKGQTGVVHTIPPGQTPDSNIANGSLLGLNPNQVKLGRGAIEALAQDIILKKNQTAFRTNFVTIKNNIITDYSGGDIKTKHSKKLINILNNKSEKSVRFYSGVGYRNITVVDNKAFNLKTVAPHEIMGQNINKYLPEGKGNEFIIDMMNKSNEILNSLPYIKQNKLKANSVWFWGEGQVRKQISFYNKFKLKGAVISAVNIINGLGKLLNMNIINVPGITGDIHSNLKNKAKYAMKYLNKYDFIYIHVEAPDEAGHHGDFKTKKLAIEKIDKEILKPLVESNIDMNIILTPDHPTPLKYRNHTNQEVPFILYSKKQTLTPNHQFKHFSEQILKQPPIRVKRGHEFLQKAFSIFNQ